MGGRAREEGFTLLELVIALAILSVAIGGLVSVLGATLRTTAVDVHRTDAVALATKEMVLLRTVAAGAAAPVDHTTTINGESYTVSDTVAWRRSSNGIDRAYRAVGVVVSWTDQGGAHRLAQDGAVGNLSAPAGLPADPCSPPEAGVAPAAVPVEGASPGLRVTWNEPDSAVVVDHWEIDTSSDGTSWVAATSAEQPLGAGATHSVEIDGLAPATAYVVRIGGVASCAATAWAPVTATTPGHPNGACVLGSVAVGPPTAARAGGGDLPGALAAGVDVTVSSLGACPRGLWAGVMTSAGSVASVALPAAGSGIYRGDLPGSTHSWDLGRHLVEIFSGTPSAGPLPVSAPLAVAVVCVEPAGVASC